MQLHTQFKPLEDDRPVDAAFLRNTRLTADQVRDVEQAMRASGMNFTEAALHLGLMTQAQIEEAVALTVATLSQQQPSIIEAAMRKVSTGREIVLRQGAPVSPGGRLSGALDMGSPRGEQLRALRTQLLLLSETGRTATTIAVVSPRAGDGRSHLAADLALSFAQLGKRTLLVDGDMRRPTLAALFDCTSEYGLADAIVHDSIPFMHPVRELPNMQFLSAGNPQSVNPLELLSDNRFAKIVHSWQSNYSFVVIDTPPTADYADAIAVATLASRALMVSRKKHTTFKDVKDMMRRLAITQARVLGAVLNDF
jgi:protein-tyrosine kinase